jgi:hypothetical protein
MEMVAVLQAMPRWKALHKKGKSRTEAETKEYMEMMSAVPALKKIPIFEQYASLMEQAGRSSAQEAALADLTTKYPDIVRAYNDRELRKMLTGRGRRRLTRRRKTTRKRK